MAQVKGIYTSGTESKKKKTVTTGGQTKSTTAATAKKTTKSATTNVPAQTTNAARQEQLREQQYRSQQSSAGTARSTAGSNVADAVATKIQPQSRENTEAAAKVEKSTAGNVPAQTTNDARQEQLRERQYHIRPQTDPQELQRLTAAKKRAEDAWSNWTWEKEYNPNNPTKLEDFYRKAGIPLSQNASFDGRVPTLEQLQEAVQRDRAETLSTEAARREQAARRKRELEELDARMEREWYSDDPQWQAAHRNVDEARDEQLAARKYQEQREREQRAYDLSTQAALDEKKAMRKRVDNNTEINYNENAWDWARNVIKDRIINNPNSYSPYQDVWDSINEKPKDLISPFAKWMMESTYISSPYDDIWNSIEDTPNGYKAVKDYFTSAKRISPTQFQVVVDSPSDMIVHTVVHLGMMGKDVVNIAKSSAEMIATASAAPTTMGASVVLAARCLGDVVLSGVSLASEMAETIDDIAHYYKEGHVIVTMGPESQSAADFIGWLVI